MVVLGTMQNNMPELPEVETVKNILSELTIGKTIESVEVLRNSTIDGDVFNFVNELKGLTIESFTRVGKFIIFHFKNEKVLISHLRMEGKFFLKDKTEKLTKHDLVVFNFTDNTKLVYNDTRRFGRIKLGDEKTYLTEPPLSNVGPDPFMLSDSKTLQKAYKNKSIAIKTALLDQSIMSGLGNIYVDETLFASKIHPETPAKLITKNQLDLILQNAKKILGEACKAGGTTIKSYHPKEGISGNFQVELKVYGKKGNVCPNCGTKLRKIFVNGRGTTYCPKCQKNPVVPELIGITGPVGAGKSTTLEYFKKHNYTTLSADQIVHDLYKNKDIQKSIKNIIPNLKIIKGDIDRESLRDYLLENPSKKIRLEKFVHTKVIEVVEKEMKKTKKPIAVEAPLLFESGLDLLCDKTIYVEASKEKQEKNLINRYSNVEKSLAINKSFKAEENKKKATYVIVNDKDVANLYKQLDTIFCK